MTDCRKRISAARMSRRGVSPGWAALRCSLLIPLVMLMLATAGCGGCDSTQQAEEDAAKKKVENKKKEDFEIKPLLPLLGQDPLPENEEEPTKKSTGPGLLVKPGHWTTTVQEMKANYDDYVLQSTTTLVDTKMKPATLDGTNFTFQSTRPVALAKGRAKRVEGELFIPEQGPARQILASLRYRSTGGLVTDGNLGQPILRKMPSYQYFIVVLSEEISKYAFLKVTDAVRMPWEEEFDAVSQAHYRVVLADAKKKLPLPSNPLTWTSVSHVIWDEVDPTRMTPEQQMALVDWVHWGGRLIVNGPDSLETLRGSFLANYLPAEGGGTRNVTTADLAGWSAYWSRRDRGERPPTLQTTKAWSGVQLKPVSAAKELVGGGELFYESQVGQGTVVVSSIQLTERDLINWPGYDSFLNAAILRRPRRIFSAAPYHPVKVRWFDYEQHRADAHLITGLRMFARDSQRKANQWREELPEGDLFGQVNTAVKTRVDREGGVGTWGEYTPVATAAREVLTEAAAVRVPGAGFVLACLGIYLVFLVPLNWMVFRALRKLEWAWVAAPVIALLGTLVIVRQAQLDIGFVRSQTEVALLELQGSHRRGLLSRFTALYSSLSTTYDVTFDNTTTVATPFPAKQNVSDKEKVWDVVFEKQSKTELRGLAVSSASTKLLHSEEMYSLDGPLQLGRSSLGHEQLENRTGYNLRDVVLVRRYFPDDGPAKYESSWIGELRKGDSTVLGFRPLALAKGEIPHLDQRREAAQERGVTKVNVEQLMNLAFRFPQEEDLRNNRREEYRVVGLIDQVLPGSEVSPAASQIVGATVVLAHLKYGELPPAEPDVNSSNDITKKKTVGD